MTKMTLIKCHSIIVFYKSYEVTETAKTTWKKVYLVNWSQKLLHSQYLIWDRLKTHEFYYCTALHVRLCNSSIYMALLFPAFVLHLVLPNAFSVAELVFPILSVYWYTLLTLVQYLKYIRTSSTKEVLSTSI